MSSPADGADLAEKYAAIAYAARPHAASHPVQMATVATLFGLSPPPPANARILEVGCSDGANILPMALTLPGAALVGCDLAARPIAAAAAAARALGLANIRFLQCDLRALPADLGTFDYIVAHGVYSWVPAPVRDALFALAADRLAPSGILYVSYNTLPGCHLRRVAWDIMHYHTDGIADPHARLDAARELCAMLADTGDAGEDSGTGTRMEFRRLAQETDSALFHDDLAVPNDPVYFHEFAAHGSRHGLRFVAEAEVWRMGGAGLTPRVRQMLAGMDALTREQYVDFARLRRFRQSLLCRGDPGTDLVPAWERIATMHVAAAAALLRAIGEGRVPASGASGDARVETSRAMLRWLAEIAPRAVPVEEMRAWLSQRAAPGAAAARPDDLLVEAYFAGMADLTLLPPPLTTTLDERPVASPLARWQAGQREQLTNLRHEPVRIEDATARQTLALLDGSRSRGQLIDALAAVLGAADRPTAAARVDHYLQTFARLALLQAG